MRELIKNVAEVISNLQTLNLLEKDNVTTALNVDQRNQKYILTVTVIVPEDILYLCLELFQNLRNDGLVMGVKENNRTDPLHSVLAVNFYEQ